MENYKTIVRDPDNPFHKFPGCPVSTCSALTTRKERQNPTRQTELT